MSSATFPPESKAHAERMIANLMAVYRDGLATLDWMGPETRREALAKLEAIVPMIAYPDEMARLHGARHPPGRSRRQRDARPALRP